jgi:hypothetical protein
VAICRVDTCVALSETGLGIPPAQIARFVAVRSEPVDRFGEAFIG